MHKPSGRSLIEFLFFLALATLFWFMQRDKMRVTGDELRVTSEEQQATPEQRVTTNVATLPIETASFPPDKALHTFPAEATVSYTADEPQEMHIIITYADILALQEQGNERIPLTRFIRNTEGTTNLTIEPDEAEYLLETKITAEQQ